MTSEAKIKLPQSSTTVARTPPAQVHASASDKYAQVDVAVAALLKTLHQNVHAHGNSQGKKQAFSPSLATICLKGLIDLCNKNNEHCNEIAHSKTSLQDITKLMLDNIDDMGKDHYNKEKVVLIEYAIKLISKLCFLSKKRQIKVLTIIGLKTLKCVIDATRLRASIVIEIFDLFVHLSYYPEVTIEFKFIENGIFEALVSPMSKHLSNVGLLVSGTHLLSILPKWENGDEETALKLISKRYINVVTNVSFYQKSDVRLQNEFINCGLNLILNYNKGDNYINSHENLNNVNSYSYRLKVSKSFYECGGGAHLRIVHIIKKFYKIHGMKYLQEKHFEPNGRIIVVKKCFQIIELLCNDDDTIETIIRDSPICDYICIIFQLINCHNYYYYSNSNSNSNDNINNDMIDNDKDDDKHTGNTVIINGKEKAQVVWKDMWKQLKVASYDIDFNTNKKELIVKYENTLVVPICRLIRKMAVNGKIGKKFDEKGVVDALELNQSLIWDNYVRYIWIGYHKNEIKNKKNEKLDINCNCFISLLPKDIVIHLIDFLVEHTVKQTLNTLQCLMVNINGKNKKDSSSGVTNYKSDKNS